MDSTFKIPGYSIDAKIGEGGMATVYLAIQESLARTVALKIMAPGLMVDPTAEKRFFKEGKIVAQLNHPNIVTVYDIGHVESVFYMAMEYIEAGNLVTRIKRGISLEYALVILRQIAQALAYAHKKGYIHRDVKPANILFKEDDHIVLSDFGIAKAVASQTQLTSIGQSIGTPECMSPEQVTGKLLDARSDLYSLGVVFYEMLTLEKPFRGEDAFATAMSHVTSPVPRLPERFSAYQIIIDRLLAKSPDERFQSAGQLISALDGLSTAKPRQVDLSQTLKTSQGDKTQFRDARKQPLRSTARGLNGTLKWVALFGALVTVIVAVVIWQGSSNIDPQAQKIIEVLLAQAERHMAASRLMEPADENAYESYRYILQFDPQNKQALAGIKEIANHYQRLALARQNEDRLEDGLELTAQGLQIDPRHSGLLALQKEIMHQQGEQRRAQEILQLFTKAEQQLMASSFISPKDDNAYTTYRQILVVDPGNEKAQKGVDKVAEHIGHRAQAELRQGRVDQSLSIVKRGLLFFPANPGMLRLRSEIQQKLAQQRERQKLETLLTKADAQIANAKFSLPVGDNALETLKAALALEPKNKRALEGLRRIAKYYERQARFAQKRGKIEQALLAITKGLEAVPGHGSLVGLQDQINRTLRKTQQRNNLLAELVAKATAQLSVSRYVAPEGANAYETFKKILTIDPNHSKAKQGLRQIATYFEQQARAAQDQGKIDQSLLLIDKGLIVQPEHASLIALRKQTLVLLDSQRKQQRVDRLLAKAQRQLADFQWTQPEDDNAFETYQEILELSAQESRALAGLQRMAKGYFQQGKAKHDQGALTESLALIEQGLLVAPKHVQLLGLKETVTRQLRETSGESVEGLLAQAQQQLDAWRLTLPADDNAYQSYKKVLKVDAGNEQANEGLREIAKRYEILVSNNRRAGDLEKALRMAELGLMVDPTHLGLQRQQKEIQSTMQERGGNVAGLLVSAQKKLKAGKYTRPKGDNAHEVYQQILEIDPNNPLAREGLQAMVKYYETQARKIKKRGDSAFEIYQQILEIDSNNALAREGLRLHKLVKRYEVQAREKKTKGALKESLSIVEKGLGIDPNSPGLLSLQSTLTQQLKAKQPTLPKSEQRGWKPKVFGGF